MEKSIADRIIYSNYLFSGLNEEPEKGGIAILNNRILAVGSKEKLLAYAGQDTVIDDYEDALIAPGFHDNHVHLLLGGLSARYANLAAARSEEEAVSLLQSFYRQNPDLLEEHDWVLGFTWSNFWWQNTAAPTRHSLDAAFPNRPVFLLNADCHGAWLNSTALEYCGINQDTPDYPFGVIARDETGFPTGYLEENAMNLAIPLAFDLPAELEAKILKEVCQQFARLGVTAVNEMQPFFGLNLVRPATLAELERQDHLPIRIYFANDLFDHEADTAQLAQTYAGGKIVHNGLKQFLDGIITTHTAVMLEPYTDAPDKAKAFPLADFNQIEKTLIRHHRLGHNLHLHATGDGAVRFALNCFEKALEINGETPSRFSIEHCDLVDEEDFSRFGRFKVAANVQPTVMVAADTYAKSPYLSVVGKDREARLWAFKSMLKGGAILSMGTDYPVAEVNPLRGIYQAMSRLYPDETPAGGFYPQERLSAYECLRAYTWGSAYCAGCEGESATLEKGKLADIAILNKNIFQLEAAEIPQVFVLETICDGKTTYRKR